MLVRMLNAHSRPPAMPHSGLYLGASRPLIGGGAETPFFLTWEPTQHTFVVGRTGAGKTTAFIRLEAEHLKLVLPFLNDDYHGATTNILIGLAEAVSAKSLLVEPWAERVIGVTALGNRDGSAYAMVQELIGFLKHHWAASWGPRLQEVLENTLEPLAEVKLTPIEATPFLSRPDFRRAVLQHINNRDVHEFWERFARLSPSQAFAICQAAVNKIGVFSRDPMLRCLFGQQHGALDFDEVLAKGYNLFNDFPTARLGNNSFLAAGLFMPAFQNAVRRRPLDAAPYSVFLDEFREMMAPEFLNNCLRSFRKFHCSLFLAAQDLDLSPALKAAIFGNCTRFVCFATSAADAAFLGREFGGHEGALVSELVPELKRGHAVVKIRGEAARLLRVDPVAPPSNELIARGRAHCLRQGKLRTEIEAEIEERYRRLLKAERRPAKAVDAPPPADEREVPEGYEGF
jgi:hypothetical protein